MDWRFLPLFPMFKGEGTTARRAEGGMPPPTELRSVWRTVMCRMACRWDLRASNTIALR